MAWAFILFSLGSVTTCLAVNREYCVRAEEVLWDYGPAGQDLMTGEDFDGHEDADLFMVHRPSDHQIGRQYWKCVYFEFVDGTFTSKKPRPQWMLRAEVRDRLSVTFQNTCTKAMTMHPHGLRYQKSFEGAPYRDGSDNRGDHVQPGETYTYLWVADEDSRICPRRPRVRVVPVGDGRGHELPTRKEHQRMH